MDTIRICVETGFEPHVAAAVTRLNYLFPTWAIMTSGDTIEVSKVKADSEAEVRREVAYALYREHILEDGRALRNRLYKLVLG